MIYWRYGLSGPPITLCMSCTAVSRAPCTLKGGSEIQDALAFDRSLIGSTRLLGSCRWACAV